MNLLTKYIKPIHQTKIAYFLSNTKENKELSIFVKIRLFLTILFYKKNKIDVLVLQSTINQFIHLDTKKKHITTIKNIFNIIPNNQFDHVHNRWLLLKEAFKIRHPYTKPDFVLDIYRYSEDEVIETIIEKAATEGIHSIGCSNIQEYKDILSFLCELGLKPKNISSQIYYENEIIAIATFEVLFNQNLLEPSRINFNQNGGINKAFFLSPLAKACLAKFPTLFEFLIEKGGKCQTITEVLNVNNNYTRSIYENIEKPIFTTFTLFEYICYSNFNNEYSPNSLNIDVLNVLLKHSDPFSKIDPNGNNFLHNMILYGQMSSVQTLFNHNFIKLNHVSQPNNMNYTPINLIEIILSKDYCTSYEKERLSIILTLLESILLKETFNSTTSKKINKI